MYLHVMAVHEPMHYLLEEEARLRLSKALALPYIIQQGASLCQLHHLKQNQSGVYVGCTEQPCSI